jgi:hypothetical protein
VDERFPAMSALNKRAAITAAEAAITHANSFGLSELEKSYLCDHVFDTQQQNTQEDGTTLPEHQYSLAKLRTILQ